MINATIEKFGYPASLIAERDHWVVLVRPQAVTLGSLILAAKGDATAYGALPAEAFAEQAQLVTMIEAALASFVDYDKINYLMLMMVDPNVHFHVIPRYEGSREFQQAVYTDAGWPGMPDLSNARPLDRQTIEGTAKALRAFELA